MMNTRKRNMVLANQMEVILWDGDVMSLRIYNHFGLSEAPSIPHWHKALEITAIFQGTAHSFLNEKRYPVCAPGICIINTEELHYVLLDSRNNPKGEELVGVTIQIDHDFLKKLIPESDEYIYEITSKEVESALFERLQHISELDFESNKTENRLRIHKEVYEIVLLLYERCRKQKCFYPINIQKDKERIRIVLEYLNNHYCDELKQAEMAKKFHFSREYFSRFFKTQTGMTFKQYLIRYRVEKAREELLHSDKRSADIAQNNGFTNETGFIIHFKELYGKTPLQYKKDMKV